MRIGITINEVFRDFIGQFGHIYNKYLGPYDVNLVEFEDFDLIKYFPFKNKEALYHFMYLEASLEIFGHAKTTDENLFLEVNKFLTNIEDDEEHEIVLISREVQKSIPSTMFFLSKVTAQFKNIRFVKNYEDKWDDIDILITANPQALEAKPEGKISVKVEAPYNKNVSADFQVKSIMELMKSEELQKQIFN